jgi:hypothetical protein
MDFKPSNTTVRVMSSEDFTISHKSIDFDSVIDLSTSIKYLDEQTARTTTRYLNHILVVENNTQH